MWIMIIKNIPVQDKYKPEIMGIYWSTLWEIEDSWINSFLNRNREDLFQQMLDDLNLTDPIFSSRSKTRKSQMDSFVRKHRDLIIDYLSKKSYFLRDNPYTGPEGYEPNLFGKRRIIIDNEAVGVFPHEYSIITSENMQMYLEECHTFEPSDTAKDVLDDLTKRQKIFKDAALLDGCTDYQASMVALGKDPNIDFPPPLGWYKCRDEVKNIFF